MIDLIKPALVLDVDGASDPSELDGLCLLERDADRSAVVRSNPGITKPAIGWNIINMADFMARAEVSAIPVSDDCPAFSLRTATEHHRIGKSARRIRHVTICNLPLNLNFAKSSREICPCPAALHPSEHLFGRAADGNSTIRARVDNPAIHA